MEKNAQTEGGYAKEMPKEYFEKQKHVVAEHIKKQDVVITTALIPGRPAPILITEEMVSSMGDGSIIVDMAVEAGGNCPLSELGEVVKIGGVTILGHSNIPSRIAEDASQLYAKNLLNFITPLVNSESKSISIDWEDEIIAGTLICKDGKIVHPALIEEK
jgi:NAD(P) transhydrogenase subunit alpha